MFEMYVIFFLKCYSSSTSSCHYKNQCRINVICIHEHGPVVCACMLL